MPSTSASLLEQLRRPENTPAWERFVQLYTPLLTVWARRHGLSEPDAADVVQDVFVVLLEKLPAFRYRPDRRFRGWLWTIVANACRDFHRRQAARPRHDGLVDLEQHVVDPQPGPEEEEYRRHLVAAALRLMQVEFPQAMWQACWLHVVEGQPAAAVARELGLAVGTVYVARSRILQRLRDELSGLLDA